MYSVYDFVLIYHYVNAISAVNKVIVCHFCHSNPDQNQVDKTNKLEYVNFHSAEKAIKTSSIRCA